MAVVEQNVLEFDPEKLTFLATVPIFAGLRTAGLVELGKVLKEQTFADGAHILSEGDRGDVLYILREGHAEILTSGNAVLITLAPSDFFGEMALFEDQPRSATVRARGECRLLALKRDQFVALVAEHPDVLWNMCAVFARRLRDMNRLVAA